MPFSSFSDVSNHVHATEHVKHIFGMLHKIKNGVPITAGETILEFVKTGLYTSLGSTRLHSDTIVSMITISENLLARTS